MFKDIFFIYIKFLIFLLLSINFSCSLVAPNSIEISLSEDRIYLNRGYDFQKRKIVSLANGLVPASFYFYQSQQGEIDVNSIGIGNPNRLSIYKLAVGGTNIDQVTFVDDISSGSYVNVVNPVETGFYAVFDIQNTYTILYIKEYVIDDRDSYILIEWRRQIDGTSSFE